MNKVGQISQKGFTLLELLVALSITAILTTVVLANFNQGNKSRSVLLATDVVLSALRTAQNDSLNPQNLSSGTCPDKVPASYDVLFDNTSSAKTYYLLAYDKCGSQQILKQYILSKLVQIRPTNGLAVDGTSLGASGGILEIRFTPPFGRLTVSSNGSAYRDFNSADIFVQSTDGATNKTVTVSGISGRIIVQ
jgi:prepilin-type N-terminal cleavage/methylation domain-containing protein